MCPQCRRLVSKNQEVCPWCGLKNPGKWFRFAGPMGYFAKPDFVLKALIALNVAFFIFSLLINLRGVGWSWHPFNTLSPDGRVLALLGSTGTIQVFGFGAWSTLLTAGFLHGSLLHLLFNMAALNYLGKLSIQTFGPFRMLLIYLGSNVTGYGLSLLGKVPWTIGASAAICGLIGALLYYGWNRGGTYGRAILAHTQGWVIGLVLFGIFGPSINNWAHAGGLLGGFALAWLLGYTENRGETMTMRLAAMAAAFVCLVFLLRNLIFAFRFIGSFT